MSKIIQETGKIKNEKNDLKRDGNKTMCAYFEQVDLFESEIANVFVASPTNLSYISGKNHSTNWRK